MFLASTIGSKANRRVVTVMFFFLLFFQTFSLLMQPSYGIASTNGSINQVGSNARLGMVTSRRIPRLFVGLSTNF